MGIFSKIFFIASGIGSQLDNGSVTKLKANIATASIGYNTIALILPKLAFSKGIASEESLLHSRRYATVGIIGRRQ